MTFKGSLQPSPPAVVTTNPNDPGWLPNTKTGWKHFRLELFKVDVAGFRLEISETQLPDRVSEFSDIRQFIIYDFSSLI